MEMALLGRVYGLDLILGTVKKIFFSLPSISGRLRQEKHKCLGRSEQHVQLSVRFSYFEVGRCYLKSTLCLVVQSS